ncbi:MAG: hypothetical protein KDC95_00680 [Planctomycetes bacterium]|nr:hypothetical protein [Planctomycetota bacterium]
MKFATLRRGTCTTLFTFVACSLPSCVLFEPTDQGKTSETPTEGPDYLEAGPTTSLDVSPGQKSLLEALKETKEQVAALQRERDELQTDVRNLQMREASALSEGSSEKGKRISLEAELAQAQNKLRDRDARLLDASIEKAKLEKRALELEIEIVKMKIAAAEAAAMGR